MAVRSDVTIDYSVSPRIAEIASPSTDVVIQDWWDTLRTIEALIWNVNFPPLIANLQSGGKQTLSPTKVAGITTAMNNLKIKFADRPGPTNVQCFILNGNLVAIDDSPVPVFIDPIEPSNFTHVVYEEDVSAGLVVGAGGTPPPFQKGVAYSDFGAVIFDNALKPALGKTITGKFSHGAIDFSPLANSLLIEVGSGKYVVSVVTAAEMNNGEVTFLFEGTGCRPEYVTIYPE